MSRGNPNIAEAGTNTRFQPGISGNLSGRPKHKPISDRYLATAEMQLPDALRKEFGLAPNSTYADAAVMAIYRLAANGDIAAVREIREAIEGRTSLAVPTEDLERKVTMINISAIPSFRVPEEE